MNLSANSLKVRASELCGITKLRWSRRPSGLYVFTFHRIGDAQNSAFDPNVFSCSSNEFERIVDFIRREFDVISVSALADLQANGTHSDRAALITFDDGYVDNYHIAMPALAERGLNATFFVATAMVEGTLPWWDQIAFWTRKSTLRELVLDGRTIDLRGQKRRAIRHVLRAFKEDKANINDKIERYRELLKPDQQLPGEQLMMNWEQLREANRAGFTIGSHTVNHPIMSHLAASEQSAELRESKAVLEKELGSQINVVAFPVGGEASFTQETMQLAGEAGYDFAFSSVGKHNHWNDMNALSLGRLSVDSGDIAELRYRVGRLN
ncbi:MAG: polysaccharide deacetylase family protein [Congregibacter sp.]